MDPPFLDSNYAHGAGTNAYLVGDSSLASYPSPQLTESLRVVAAPAAAGTASGLDTDSLGHLNSRFPEHLPALTTFPCLAIASGDFVAAKTAADQEIRSFAQLAARLMAEEANRNGPFSRVDTAAPAVPPCGVEQPCRLRAARWEPSDEDLDVCVELDRAWDTAEKPLDDEDQINAVRFDLNQENPVLSQKRQRDSVCSSNDVQDGCLSDTASSELRIASNEDSGSDTKYHNGVDLADDHDVKRDTGRRAERERVFPTPEGQVSRGNRRWRSAPPRLAEKNPLHHVRHTKLDKFKQSFSYGSRAHQELHSLLQGLIGRLHPALPMAAVVSPAAVPMANAETHAADEANLNAEVDAAVTAMSAGELEQMDMKIIMEVDDCWLRENTSDVG